MTPTTGKGRYLIDSSLVAVSSVCVRGLLFGEEFRGSRRPGDFDRSLLPGFACSDCSKVFFGGQQTVSET